MIMIVYSAYFITTFEIKILYVLCVWRTSCTVMYTSVTPAYRHTPVHQRTVILQCTSVPSYSHTSVHQLTGIYQYTSGPAYINTPEYRHTAKVGRVAGREKNINSPNSLVIAWLAMIRTYDSSAAATPNSEFSGR